jgi:hypothetical protein
MTDNRVYLKYPNTGNEHRVSDEGYQVILDVLAKYSICKQCECYFTNENPNIAGLLCLKCFLKDFPSFVFKGEFAKQGYKAYWYVCSTDGMCYYTIAGGGSDTKPREDKRVTIKHWKFPLPIDSMDNRCIPLPHDEWLIYGDIQHDKVIIIRYLVNISNYDKIDITFIATRGKKKAVLFNKHMQLFRNLWSLAEAEHKASGGGKDSYAVYKIIARNLNLVTKDECEHDKK